MLDLLAMVSSGSFIAGILIFIAVIVLLSGLCIAQEYERSVIFRLGRYQKMRGPGLFWIIPLGIERQVKVDMRTLTVSVEKQETITKDSVTAKINAVLWYKIVDPEKAIIAVEDYHFAVYEIALTTLRNIIGQHVLDEVLKLRNTINEALCTIVDEATEAWGIKIEMVQMKDVEIPTSMQRIMAMEAEAVREKRARIIKAEAESEASQKLADASKIIAANPLALELRRMQMVQEVGAEHNTTTIVLLPSDMISMASSITNYLNKSNKTAEA
jgi:regulator of protease activity HflC (stomatin/prohibitin superfamily)